VSFPSIIIIYFFYGLAFFSMGLLVLEEGGRSPDARLRRALRPLAAFGLVHAANEWLEMFEAINKLNGGALPDWLSAIRLAMLVFSFLSLAAFGSYLTASTQKTWRLSLLVPLGLEAIWVFGLVMLRAKYPLPELWNIADVWSRYSLAIPAALLAAVGLLVQQRVFRHAGMVAFGRDALWAAIAFAWYGLGGQLFGKATLLPPSNVINEVVFQNLLGIPVQLFRAVAAGLASFFVIRFLRSFQVVIEKQISDLQAARLKEAEERDALRGELFNKVVAAQEAERQRIARELHDETGQALTAIGMGLRGLESNIRKSRLKTAEQNVKQMETLAVNSLDELQRLILDLRPSHLDDLGLAPALRWYANDIEERTKLQVNVEIKGDERPVSSVVKTALFRIVQEALTNVIKHAQADSVTITLTFTRHVIKVRVTDNGRGFEPQTTGAVKRKTWGLQNMEERASLLGGDFNIHSSPGEGVRIEVSIPDLEEKSNENTPAAR
jgi:signal transduction histidine kinase